MGLKINFMKSFFVSLLIIAFLNVSASDTLSYSKTEIIYGRKYGTALTMTMLVPKQKNNGKAIISVLSGNWVSTERMRENFPSKSDVYLERGYTVFGVMVGSQPQYSIPDEIKDLKRAVRFIRFYAKEYNIDADHLGITGFSSGGHLSLMIATADNNPDSKSFDPVDKVSARVQAAAVFAPPTDFLNYGKQNSTQTINQAMLVISGLAPAFDFKTWNDTTGTFVSITNTAKRLQIAKEISPVNNVSADDPPILIIHGNKDVRVPLQQSESIIKKLKEVNVSNNLIIKDGAGHGWKNMEVEEKNFADWFDKYLK